MGHFYPWATPDYLLNQLTLDQFLMYWNQMVYYYSEDGPPAQEVMDEPDLEKFRELYGTGGVIRR